MESSYRDLAFKDYFNVYYVMYCSLGPVLLNFTHENPIYFHVKKIQYALKWDKQNSYHNVQHG